MDNAHDWLAIRGYERFGAPVPGVGPVLSCWQYREKTFARRANEEGLVIPYLAEKDGWRKLEPSEIVEMNNG